MSLCELDTFAPVFVVPQNEVALAVSQVLVHTKLNFYLTNRYIINRQKTNRLSSSHQSHQATVAHKNTLCKRVGERIKSYRMKNSFTCK